jgi:Spy/CpxP family protein refolding chaperone
MGLALCVLPLAIAAGAFQIRQVGADDVKVFVLPPGGPATQPHETPKPAGPSKLTEQPPKMPLTDDRVIDSALLRDLRLAPDQIAKLSPILKEAAQEFEAASQGYKTKYQALRDNYESRKAAAATGGKVGSTQPDIQEMRDRTQAWEEYQKQKAQLRERVIARIVPVLTEEQRARFTDAVEDLEERPETANRRAVRTLIGMVAPYM